MSRSAENPPERRTLDIDEAEWLERIGPRRHALLCLWTRDVTGRLEAALAESVTAHSVLLDAGSSRGEQDLPSIGRARLAIACDVDRPGLRANRQARGRIEASLEALPFAAGSIDVIACKWVVEHLPAPDGVFAEFQRVLKPGGRAAILTPNAHSLFGLISGLIPHALKQWVKEKLFGGLREDTFPTFYRANTPSRLPALMARAGFTPVRLELLSGLWVFFIFAGPLARALRALERLQMRLPGLRRLSAHLLGVWEKR